MARKEFLKLVIEHAARNSFEFERWFAAWCGQRWTTQEAAIDYLADDHRYYALLFSHEFACAFWRQGTRVTFKVPPSTYTRRDKSGAIVEVQRKAYIRRRLKPEAWIYHLREMAATDEPLKYVRRFLLVAPPASEIPSKPAQRAELPPSKYGRSLSR